MTLIEARGSNDSYANTRGGTLVIVREAGSSGLLCFSFAGQREPSALSVCRGLRGKGDVLLQEGPGMAALNLGQNSAAPQDPGPGTANKGHDQLVLGKGTFSMEPLAQLRSQGLSLGIRLGSTLPGPPTAPCVPP